MRESLLNIPLNSLALRLLRIIGATAGILLFASVMLYAQSPASSVEGEVRNTAGIAIAGAKIILKDGSGRALASTFTNTHGLFRLPLTNGGPYELEVERAGYSNAIKTNINAASVTSARLTFVLKSAPQAEPRGGLGAISFYQGPEFKPGTLKDPSAGGGYSDQALTEENQMIGQYLAPAGTALSKERPDEKAKSSEEGFETLGAALLAQRDYARATPLYRQAVNRFPHSSRLQTGLGVALYGQGQYPAAVEALCAAAHLAPDDPSIYLLLSEAMQLTPHPNLEAAQLVKNFADGHPQVAVGHYAYALNLWRSFRLDHGSSPLAEAQTELEKAVSLDPSLTAAHLQLGMVYDEQKLTTRAIEQYRAAVRLNPNLAAAHYRLAEDDERSGAKRDAASEFEIYERLRKKLNK